MKLNEIQDLIKFVAKSGVSEVELETKDIKIIIKTPSLKGKEQAFVQPVTQQATQAAPVTQQGTVTSTEIKMPEIATPTATGESNYITIKAPMVGTFYRSSSPDKPVFVNVGDEVAPGKVICIIEAMKLFNEIESEVQGKIVKVLVNDATPVEYDQALFLIDPS